MNDFKKGSKQGAKPEQHQPKMRMLEEKSPNILLALRESVKVASIHPGNHPAGILAVERILSLKTASSALSIDAQQALASSIKAVFFIYGLGDKAFELPADAPQTLKAFFVKASQDIDLFVSAVSEAEERNEFGKLLAYAKGKSDRDLECTAARTIWKQLGREDLLLEVLSERGIKEETVRQAARGIVVSKKPQLKIDALRNAMEADHPKLHAIIHEYSKWIVVTVRNKDYGEIVTMQGGKVIRTPTDDERFKMTLLTGVKYARGRLPRYSEVMRVLEKQLEYWQRKH
jgi:hypothetical protein